METPADAVLQVYGMDGKIIYSSKLGAIEDQILVSTKSWSTGMYQFRIEFDNQTISTTKVEIIH